MTDRIALRASVPLFVLATVAMHCLASEAAAARAPEFPPGAPAWSGRSTLVMSGGVWHRYAFRKLPEGQNSQLIYFESDDEGLSWSEPYVAGEIPGDNWGGGTAVLDRRGELQLFFTRSRREGEGNVPAVNRFIDVWHVRSTDGRTRWEAPRQIFAGYTGAISPAIRLSSGRILMPIGMWMRDKPRGAPFGTHEVSAFYSDDDGATFVLSPARLVAPVDDDYNGDKVGACEPAAVELRDGRVLMMMRTQAGTLYQSVSTDGGATWPDAHPSPLYSSTGPPSLIRLPHDRIVLFWNHCAMPPKVDGRGVYGGRDALHAAIADPDLKRWRGLREVYRDPTPNLEPPRRGDRGTAYPESLLMKDGRVAVMSGQGGRRALFYVDPEWLEETRQSEDFSGGLGAWHVFKPFGPAEGWWRNRTQGATLVDHPGNPAAKVLHLRRADEKAPDGASRNFPAGAAGTLILRFMLPEGSAGGGVALVDRFFDPTDDQGEAESMIRLPLSPGGTLGSATLTPGRWHTLSLAWDSADGPSGACHVTLDGAKVATIPLAKPTHTGLSYLRLRSTAADTVDPVGWFVERVDVEISRP